MGSLADRIGTSQDKTYGVFAHSSGPNGGYVVRTLRNGWVAAPYSATDALRVFKREAIARRHADKLNASKTFAYVQELLKASDEPL